MTGDGWKGSKKTRRAVAARKALKKVKEPTFGPVNDIGPATAARPELGPELGAVKRSILGELETLQNAIAAERRCVVEAVLTAGDAIGLFNESKNILREAGLGNDVDALEKESQAVGCGFEHCYAGILVCEGEVIEKCDDCATFEDDEDAMAAVIELLKLLKKEYEAGVSTVADAFDRLKEKFGGPTVEDAIEWLQTSSNVRGIAGPVEAANVLKGYFLPEWKKRKGGS